MKYLLFTLAICSYAFAEETKPETARATAAATSIPDEQESNKEDLNKEVPNILYVVPWSDAPAKKAKDPKLVLHDFMGDLYEPQLSDSEISSEN